MKNNFICESANIDELDPEFEDILSREPQRQRKDRRGDVQQLRLRRHQRFPHTSTLQRLTR